MFLAALVQNGQHVWQKAFPAAYYTSYMLHLSLRHGLSYQSVLLQPMKDRDILQSSLGHHFYYSPLLLSRQKLVGRSSWKGWVSAVG